ncbi:hypothetical protein [Methylobacterium symbioticum]|jgi:hypothetical protein|uniref:Uncharacterized protein n=2 Tax=Methylobacterium TaxID=407 RepID=A0A509EMW8_9HYPH|nr:hypothetical protein MET9862_05398 [Methylobacterium symbioticum]
MKTWPLLRPMPATARLQRDLHREALQFRIILGLTYPLFLAAAVLQRLRPAPLRTGAPAPRRSVFGEARAMAAQAVPFAFMG